MFFVFIAFGAPIFGAIACIIESRLSNYTFKRQTTMIFYISLMNCVFLPLAFVWGAYNSNRNSDAVLYGIGFN